MRVDKIVKSQTKTSSYLRLKETNKQKRGIKSGFKYEDENGKENEFVFFIFDTNLSLTVTHAI